MTKFVVVALACALGSGGYTFLFGPRGLAPVASREPPIRFDHLLHHRNNVPCEICHSGVKRGGEAGVPRAETCLRCHEDLLGVGPEEAKIEAFRAKGGIIPWSIFIRVKEPFVWFPHRTHVAVAKLECEGCHGPVGARRVPVDHAVRDLRGSKGMAWCLSCHEEKGASTDCVACHR